MRTFGRTKPLPAGAKWQNETPLFPCTKSTPCKGVEARHRGLTFVPDALVVIRAPRRPHFGRTKPPRVGRTNPPHAGHPIGIGAPPPPRKSGRTKPPIFCACHQEL